MENYSADYDEYLVRKDSILLDRIDTNQALEDLLAGISADNISGGVFGATSKTGGIQFDSTGSLSFVQSRNFVSGSTGFRLDSDGNIEANSLTLIGGTIKYGKTAFTDTTNAGYHISSAGFYFGSASDASYIKYNIATGALAIVATISGRASSVIAAAIDASGNFVNNLINANLDTSAKQILGDFIFGVSGAIKMITDANNGIWLSPTGILGKTAGVTTFSIGIDGSATFAGTLSGASGTFGTITAGTITGVTLSGTINHTAGDILYQSANTTRSHTNSDYTLKKAITVYHPGAYRVKFTVWGSDTSCCAFGRIYKNDVAVGTERSNSGGVPTEYSEDISGLVSGDVIQLYTKWTGTGGQQVSCSNFRLYVSQYDSSVVTTD